MGTKRGGNEKRAWDSSWRAPHRRGHLSWILKEQSKEQNPLGGTWAGGTAGTKAWRCGACPHEGISEPWQPEFQILIPSCQLGVHWSLEKRMALTEIHTFK